MIQLLLLLVAVVAGFVFVCLTKGLAVACGLLALACLVLFFMVSV